MSQSRLEIKVGLFVLLCLAVLAVLLLQFSKGVTLFRQTYTLKLNTGNVGGLRPRASVLMSGVQIGTVSRTVLSPEGTNVTIILKIYSQQKIRDDALFKIEQSGFLGDQYVAIYPGKSEGALLGSGAEVHAVEPFNLQEVARATSGFIQRLDITAKKLDDAINNIRRLVLNDNVLTNLADTVVNFRRASEDALVTVENINLLVTTNRRAATAAISNLLVFSGRLNEVADRAHDFLATNAPQLTLAISNVHTSTAMLTNLLGGLEAGRGLAGAFLKDEKLSGDVAGIASNWALTMSNLNRLGFWHFIWYKPKPPATNAPPAAPTHGRNP